MEFVLGFVFVIIVYTISSITTRLKSIEKQNSRVIEVLEEIRDK